ncbi:electron transport complex subunit RsxC [Aliiglaciecola lipolytica]|uniref:Ion-translocating oxidoreductase complex subunit C n=1 Tax=Aliiglaciecola lipolytica E3 TaxID=1127673 RepID=K6YA23_9ALTE|nr:electron transport complex subunit RsxC [Aliiglaciecola lipolytica]GAC13508.1 electron transport complex protein RnfC [Aliiglaciecola lipolytica E3]
MYSDYDSILQRLKQGKLWDFPGGVHPPELKDLSNQKPIETIPMPKTLHVMVKQHIGVEGGLLVTEGDRVLKGQALTHSTNPFSVPVHAPTSGYVARIAQHVSAHPSGLPELAIDITTDEFETWAPRQPILDYQQKPKAKIIEAICNAGISGMGGAGFPTHIKSSPKKDVEFLIINGVECEPYITSDDRLMREHAWQIRQGIDILVHLLSPKLVIIAVEDNKPEAIEAMQVACQENAKYRVISVPTKYPAGGEKQLIQILTNREVPGHGLPIDVGVIMQNVGTCFAIADAIFTGTPLIRRVVTLTGKAFKRPQNVWAPIGTPISHLLDIGHYKQHKQRAKKLIMGGPMMGFEIVDDEVPVVKITNCILAPAASEIQQPAAEQPCIRCSACADACPASLLPQQLFWHSQAKEYEKASELNLFDCIECGACAYVCPSEIPLVHYYRVAKADIRSQEQEKAQADKARIRFEARKERLEREQKEREEKHARAAEARRQAMSEKGNDAKDKIAAALARAKAKKQANSTQADIVEPDSQATSTHSNAEPEQSATTSKQDKVAAAIARAKAKRAAAKADNNNESTEQATSTDSSTESQQSETTSKQDKVAAAIARAKAKRAAAKAQSDAVKTDSESTANGDSAIQNPPTANEETQSSAVDESAAPTKQDKVAIAIAKAKAKREAVKKAQQAEKEATLPDSNTTDAQETNTVAAQHSDEVEQKTAKQKAVAAAIAKAKAKKLANAKTDELAQNQPKSSTQDSAETAPPTERSQTPEKLTATQLRKQKVEAAVAKAREENRLKKLKREQKNTETKKTNQKKDES